MTNCWSKQTIQQMFGADLLEYRLCGSLYSMFHFHITKHILPDIYTYFNKFLRATICGAKASQHAKKVVLPRKSDPLRQGLQDFPTSPTFAVRGAQPSHHRLTHKESIDMRTFCKNNIKEISWKPSAWTSNFATLRHISHIINIYHLLTSSSK